MTITLTNTNYDFISKKLKEYFFETFKDAKFDYTSGMVQDNNVLATECQISDVSVDNSKDTLSIELTGKDGNGNDVNISVPEQSKIFFNSKKLNIMYGDKSAQKVSLVRDTKSVSHRWYSNSMEPLNQEMITGYVPKKKKPKKELNYY